MTEPLDLAVIGAGPIGILSATQAAKAGHRVGMWNPRGRSPAPERYALKCTGALDAEVEVEAIADPAALAKAQTVLIAIPATAYQPVLSAVAPHLRQGQDVIFSGALSLAQLWLREKTIENGSAPAIATWGTTLGTAIRVSPMHAHVTSIRPRLTVTASPSHRVTELVARCAALFPGQFEAADEPLATLLSNINPVAHAGQVIPNLSRIEKGEEWSLYGNFRHSGVNISMGIDAERLAIARSFGLEVRPLDEHYRLSFGVDREDVVSIAQAIEQAGRPTPGPTSITHRYIEEDVPFGLVVLQRLGRMASIPTPVLDVSIALLSCALQRPFQKLNTIIDDILTDDESLSALSSRLRH